MSILGSISNLPFSGHHDLYNIISSWKVEQNQAVKAATQGKASPAKIRRNVLYCTKEKPHSGLTKARRGKSSGMFSTARRRGPPLA